MPFGGMRSDMRHIFDCFYYSFRGLEYDFSSKCWEIEIIHGDRRNKGDLCLGAGY